MRIVFNLRDQDWQTTKSLGILHVSTRILEGLAALPSIDCIDVLANRSLAAHLAPLQHSERCRLHYAAAPAPRGWQRVLWDHWSVVRACDTLAPGWLLLPKGFSPLLRWPRCRVSAYVHDDIFGFYRRQALSPFPSGQSALFTRMLRRTAARADVIVTNSAFTADEFAAAYAPAQRPVRIGAPLATPAAPPAPPPSAATVSLLVPTSTWPHKLCPQAIAWVQRWTASTGFRGRIHGFGTLPRGSPWPDSPGWTHHGRIDDAALARLEREAAVLIYFSAYEGYGLPPVEAAAAGRRAIASDLPPLRETLPEAALFDNGSYESFARTLARTLSQPALPPLRAETAAEVAARWAAQLADAARRPSPRHA